MPSATARSAQGHLLSRRHLSHPCDDPSLPSLPNSQRDPLSRALGLDFLKTSTEAVKDSQESRNLSHPSPGSNNYRRFASPLPSLPSLAPFHFTGFFFLINFMFRTILESQKSCQGQAEFAYTQPLVSPSSMSCVSPVHLF